MTLSTLTGMVDAALRHGRIRPNTRNRPGTIYEIDLVRIIGVSGDGMQTGEVTFRVDDSDLSPTGWTWVPVFDFAAALHGTVAALEPGSVEIFEYTENEHLIRVRRTGDEVTISATYVDAVATVTHEELLAATAKFLDELAQDLLARHPSLGRNKHFTDLVFKAQ